MTAKLIYKYTDEVINETIALRAQGVTYPMIQSHFADKGINVRTDSLRGRINLQKRGMKYVSDSETLAVTDDVNKKQWQSILYNPTLSYVA